MLATSTPMKLLTLTKIALGATRAYFALTNLGFPYFLYWRNRLHKGKQVNVIYETLRFSQGRWRSSLQVFRGEAMSHFEGIMIMAISVYQIETARTFDPDAHKPEEEHYFHEWFKTWAKRDDVKKWEALYKRYGTDINKWPDDIITASREVLT